MTAQVLSGAPVAAQMLAEACVRAGRLPQPPGLALVLVGDDPASAGYVRSKHKKAAEAGIESQIHALPAGTTQAELLALLERLNGDPAVHGVLVQLPLPEPLDEAAAVQAVDPRKDVDGLHPLNAAALWAGHPVLPPCTPAGILQLLAYYGIPVAGQRAAVVGRSELVGRPAAALLLAADATVTTAHRQTCALAAVTREADLLIVAAGHAGLITPDMVKPGAAVIDVGINRVTVDGKTRTVGDVDPAAAEVAGALTPVPGGVGPLTIAQLMLNTVHAAELQQG